MAPDDRLAVSRVLSAPPVRTTAPITEFHRGTAVRAHDPSTPGCRLVEVPRVAVSIYASPEETRGALGRHEFLPADRAPQFIRVTRPQDRLELQHLRQVAANAPAGAAEGKLVVPLMTQGGETGQPADLVVDQNDALEHVGLVNDANAQVN